MGGFYLEVFCSGNMTSQEVEDYIKCFSKKLGLTKDVMKENQFRQERVYKVELTFNLASLSTLCVYKVKFTFNLVSLVIYRNFTRFSGFQL